MRRFSYILFAIVIFIVGCGLNTESPEEKGLKDFYQDYFTIGAAVTPASLTGEEATLLNNQFNSLTAENVMKFIHIHPEANRFNWGPSDKIVEFAQTNGMKVRGHTLIWHKQLPKWIFVNEKGDTVSKEVLLARMEHHITEVVSHYKGKVYAWDVVNEAISDKKDEYLKPTPWLKICGEEYIAKAFEFAHRADPDALLFYNDYNEINPVKREKIIKLVKSLQAAGIPIHGVGLQGHWAVNEPSFNQLDSTLKRFSEIGIDVQITELDISIYNKPYIKGISPDTVTSLFTAQKEQQQSEAYRMCFELFRKHHKSISSVTFWNVSDKHSWLDNFPVRGRKDYPLLFDQELKPKKAYWEVVNFSN